MQLAWSYSYDASGSFTWRVGDAHPLRSTTDTKNLTSKIMQVTTESGRDNPLEGLISDDLYDVLDDHNLLSEKGVRDYKRRSFETWLLRRMPRMRSHLEGHCTSRPFDRMSIQNGKGHKR